MFKPAEMVKLYSIFPRRHLNEVLIKLQELGAVELFDVKKELPLYPIDDNHELVTAEVDRAKRLLSEFKTSTKASFIGELIGPKSIEISIEKEPTREVLSDIKERLDSIEEEYQFLLYKKEDLLRGKEGLLGGATDILTGQIPSLFSLADRAELAESENISEDKKEILAKLSALGKEARLFKQERYPKLLEINEVLQNLTDRVKAISYLGSTPHSVVLGCWAPTGELEKIKNTIGSVTDEAYITEIKNPSHDDDVPTLLENPSILKPFEVITECYGLPKYHELDPTPILAFTFTLFFGIMFADVGYGATLTLLSAFLLMKSTSAEKITRGINTVLIWVGLSGVLFGFIFGEFFGGLIELEPLWMNPVHNIEFLLVLAVSIGVCHISISLIARFFGELRGGKHLFYAPAVLIILWSSIILIVLPQFSLPAKLTLALGGIILYWQVKFEAVDELLALFANIVSYTRIAALLTVHAMMAKAFTSLALSFNISLMGTLITTVVFVIGAAVLLISGALLVFIHSLRLHWLEFFKRFYSAQGKKFKPFAATKKYTFTMPFSMVSDSPKISGASA